MLSREKVIEKAAELKHRLLNRSKSIASMSAQIASYDAGLKSFYNARTVDTARESVTAMVQKQNRDSLIFAVYRMVLGITEEIEEDNLGLEDE